jgi:hypothetical protein
VTDWRYFVGFEGIVSTATDNEQEAIDAALEDVANGKIPNVEVEEIEG